MQGSREKAGKTKKSEMVVIIRNGRSKDILTQTVALAFWKRTPSYSQRPGYIMDFTRIPGKRSLQIEKNDIWCAPKPSFLGSHSDV